MFCIVFSTFACWLYCWRAVEVESHVFAKIKVKMIGVFDMINKYAEYFKEVGMMRARAMDGSVAWLNMIPRNWLEGHVPVHFVLLMTTILCVCQVFARTRSISLFSLHPVMLTIGIFLFLAEGLMVRQNHVLYEFFMPIMQGSRKRKQRTIHMNLQVIGSSFMAAGLISILSHKIEIGKSIIPMTIHSIVGTMAVLMVGIQVVSGFQKMNKLQHTNTKTLRWHGDVGLFSFDLMVLASMLGALSFLSWDGMWTFVLCGGFFLSWFLVNIQVTRKTQGNESEDEATTGLVQEEEGERRKGSRRKNQS